MKCTDRYTLILALLVPILLDVFRGDGSVHAFSSSAPSFHPLQTASVTRHTHTNHPARVSALGMVKPGRSEAQQRQDREDEIRSKMAQLKNAGRMGSKGGDLSESMVQEAEAFFNKESPVRKFERQTKERKEREAILLDQEKSEASDENNEA